MDNVEPREFAPGVWWLPQCLVVPIGETVYHAHIAQYLVVGRDRALLFDTSMPAGWEVLSGQLDHVLGGRSVDYVVPSHPEVPHCANILSLLEKYPDSIAVGDMRDYPLYYPTVHDRFVQVETGTELELGGGYRFRLLPGLVKDLPTTQWGFEVSQRVLFASDAFICAHHLPPGHEFSDEPVHLPYECTSMTSELAAKPVPEQLVMLTRAALTWPSYVHIDRYLDPLLAMMSECRPRFIAVAHGPVIDQPETIMPMLWDTLRQTYEGVDAPAA
jgi:hypothetical protein